jgi:hypothetical protein
MGTLVILFSLTAVASQERPRHAFLRNRVKYLLI